MIWATKYFVITGLFVLLNTGAAFPCSCGLPLPAPAEEMRHNSSVFSGKVISIEELPDEDVYQVRFEVIKSWKGIDGKDVIVLTGTDLFSCGYPFEKDKEYLVYSGSLLIKKLKKVINRIKNLRRLL